ncbi:MAG: ribonuclease HI [Flavobacteriaceae bacterium]|nr:ribonuclease HI [Flavobacteriaceae bacterium]
MNPDIIVYTDGSSRGNPGPGGYGIVMQKFGTDYLKEFSEGFKKTTNNRMELLAVIVALEKIKKEKQHVHIYTDSKYVSESVEKKWVENWEKKQFKNKKNPDLWTRFLKIYRKHKVCFFWVKGHNNNSTNERCDFLAVQASKNKVLKADTYYENN